MKPTSPSRKVTKTRHAFTRDELIDLLIGAYTALDLCQTQMQQAEELFPGDPDWKAALTAATAVLDGQPTMAQLGLV